MSKRRSAGSTRFFQPLSIGIMILEIAEHGVQGIFSLLFSSLFLF
jgi:hypothetical protein